MKKYTDQKGQGLIEYALLLAIVVGIGSLIYSGSGLKDSISSIFGNSSNLLGTVASASKDPSSNLSGDDRNMKWLQEEFMSCINQDWFQKQIGNVIKKRNTMDFTNQLDNKIGGLCDSDSDSKFMNNFDDSDLGDCSWVMTEYTKDGQAYYGVSIYDPAKNGNKKLSEQSPGDRNITTDIYKIDPKTGTVTKVASDVKQSTFSHTDKGKTYNVIRGYKE